MKKVVGIMLAAVMGLSLCQPIKVFANESETVPYDISAEEGDNSENSDIADNGEAAFENMNAADDENNAAENGDIAGNDETSNAGDTANNEEPKGEVSSSGQEKPQEVQGYLIDFDSFEGGKIVAYDRKNFDEAVIIDGASSIVARDSDTGEIDVTGNGQANFSVVLENGYILEKLDITEGEGNYKNLKSISEEGNVYTYRITKITGNIRVKIETKKLGSEGERALLIEELTKTLSSYPVYYTAYCTDETAIALTQALDKAKSLDYGSVSNEEIENATNNIKNAVDDLVYKTAEVPQIYISTVNGNGNSLEKKTGYVDTSIVVADKSGNIIDNAASIKVRGNSTAEAEKKPYNIKFSSKQDVLGMGKAKKWCLLANCLDASLMRNSVAFHVAQELGLPYTSENCFVEVWIDGVFRGCYLLTEAVEAGKTRVEIDADGDEFMIELEKERAEGGTTYFTNAYGLRFAFKEPEEPSAEKVAAVKATMDRITAIIDSGDYNAVCEAIDIDSFAKFYVVNEYMRNGDFNYSSVYFFYKNGVLYAGPAWDFDLSSGNVRDVKHVETAHAHASRGNFYPYLLKYSEFQKKIEDTFAEYADILESVTSDGGYIDTTYQTNKAVIERNFKEAGWIVSKRYSDYQMIPLATYEENLQYLKNWLSSRMDWIKKYYADLIPNVWVYPAQIGEDFIGISWREEEGVDGYRVYRFEGDTKAPITGVIQGNYYNDYTAEAGVEYRYDVVAVVNGNQGTRDYVGVAATLPSKTETEFKITRQPTDFYVQNDNDIATFSVEAIGRNVKYMWYLKTPDSDRFVKTGNETNVYTRKMFLKNDGLQVYCVVTDAYGHKEITNTATASFNKKFEIVKDTEDQLIARIGSMCTFTIDAVGDGVTYSWYYKMPEHSGGDGKFHKAGCYTNEYKRTASEKTDGMQAYCVVKDKNGEKLQGRTATLILDTGKLTITYPNGKTLSAEKGKTVTFKVETNIKDVSYSWYYMLSEQGGGDGKFHKAGCYTNEYIRTVAVKRNGMQAYCVITDSNGEKTNSDVMTLVMK